MPEIAIYSPNAQAEAPRLDLSYSEASVAFRAVGDDLDNVLHGRKVVSSHTVDILSLLDGKVGCERIADFLTEQYATFAFSCDSAAEWSAIGFES